MPIVFNGDVTIHGNVEMYSDGSMKITHINPITIPLTDLELFIERRLGGSPSKQDYLGAADALKNSTDTRAIQRAAQKLKRMGKDIGRDIIVQGIPRVAVEAIKALLLGT